MLLAHCVRLSKRPRGFLLVAFLIGAGSLGSNGLMGQELSIPTVVANGGTTVTTSVEFRAEGAAVAALQFDLEFDSSVLAITPSVGSAAAAAGKILAWAALPGGAGIRAIIYGLNQNVIGDGGVADLMIQVNANSAVGPYKLHLLNALGASPSGDAVSIGVRSGQVIRIGPPNK